MAISLTGRRWICFLLGALTESNELWIQFCHMWYSSSRAFGNSWPCVCSPLRCRARAVYMSKVKRSQCKVNGGLVPNRFEACSAIQWALDFWLKASIPPMVCVHFCPLSIKWLAIFVDMSWDPESKSSFKSFIILGNIMLTCWIFLNCI